MNVSALKNFVCPVDERELFKENNSLQCDKGHVYDLAREGYCNLLLVQQKASLDPGDSREMVASRRRFLDGGFFTPIAQRLFKIVSELAEKSGNKVSVRIVDAGCGEGYYLRQLSTFAGESKSSARLELAGCDISKWAVKTAAKRSKDISWAVASNKHLPFSPESVDFIFSMFGFPVWESFKALQPDGGRVVLVDPGQDHLIELRKIIYPEVNVSEPPSLFSAMEAGYILERQEVLKFSVNLPSNSSLRDLLAMTPHAFRISQKAKEGLGALKHLTVSADVIFRILKKGK